jgi:hypothetical protein
MSVHQASAPGWVGRAARRLASWRPRALAVLLLAGAGGLAAVFGLSRVWPSPPFMAPLLLFALLLLVAAGLVGLLLSAALGARLRASWTWRVLAGLALGAAWVALCDWVVLRTVPRWIFNQGSREAVTTIRPAAGGGPVFDVYRVTDGRPLLAVRRGVWSELVHEAEDGGDFADYVDVVVRGHHLVFDPGGASRDRSATIDGRPAVVESRR